MALYTGEALDNLSKSELIGISMLLQNRFKRKNYIKEEIRNLNQKFSQLQSETIADKQVNTLLAKKLLETELFLFIITLNCFYSKLI